MRARGSASLSRAIMLYRSTVHRTRSTDDRLWIEDANPPRTTQQHLTSRQRRQSSVPIISRSELNPNTRRDTGENEGAGGGSDGEWKGGKVGPMEKRVDVAGHTPQTPAQHEEASPLAKSLQSSILSRAEKIAQIDNLQIPSLKKWWQM